MSDGGVCRTAPATLGLSFIFRSIPGRAIKQYSRNMCQIWQGHLFVPLFALPPIQHLALQEHQGDTPLAVEGERGERRAIAETSQAQGGWQYHDDSLSRTHSHPLSRPWLLTKHKPLNKSTVF